jgi:hypothetical protein
MAHPFPQELSESNQVSGSQAWVSNPGGLSGVGSDVHREATGAMGGFTGYRSSLLASIG